MGIFSVMGRVGQLVAVVLIFMGSLAYAQGVPLSSLIKNNPDGSQTLLHHVPQAVVKGLAKEIASASASQILDLRIILPSKDPAGLDSFIKELYDPKSPNYHKFLTPQEFTQQFGASAVDSSLVQKRLASYGLTIKSISANGLVLTVSASVSAVQNTFKLHIQNYKRSDGTSFFAPDTDPTIPTEIAGKIARVVGLDNAVKFVPHFNRTSLPLVAKSAAKTVPAKGASPAFSGPQNTLEPNDFLTAYNLNPVSSTGAGQALALYELDGYLTSDITKYETTFSIPNIPLANVYTDGATGSAGSATDEVVLDIDLGVAMAPGLSQILVYEAPNTGPGWIDQWDRIASDDIAKSISCSWGLDEPDSNPYDHTIFSQLVAQGQTVFASSGDAGAYDACPAGSPNCGASLSVDDPASDPYVTGVGISVLSVNNNGTYNSETASLYGGGGISTFWSIPTFQQGLTLAPGSLVSTTMRNVPDVVFTADPATMYYIYITDPTNGAGWYGVWGSSAASPLWAAFLTRVNQGRVAAGESVVGYLNPAIYAIDQAVGAQALHDITTGNNSFYPAKAGYDDASGLGSFNGLNLYNDFILAGPTGVTATAGNAKVTLNWTASFGAIFYNVKRATVNGGPYTTISTGGSVTGTSYIDTSVTSGTTYYYVVSVVETIGESKNSSQVSATPFSGPPSAPTGLAATPGSTQAILSWVAVNTAASYNVKRSLVSGGPYTTVSSSGSVTNTTYTDTGLTNGRIYYYVVSGVNTDGEGVNSVQASVTPQLQQAGPTNLKATILGARVGNTIITGGISLTWTQSTAPGGVIHNKVYRAAGSGPYSLLSSLGVATSYSDTNVVKGTTYKYEVTAVNSHGEESLFSNVVTVSY